MIDIRLIDETTDLSHLKKPIGWDLEIGGEPYDIYHVEGYCHTYGGHRGANCYWACPAGEKPTYQNLIPFNGDAPTWGITFERFNHIRSSSIDANGRCWITRNGKNFYKVPARYLDYGLAKAQYLLVQLLEECPLDLNERDWKEKAVGKKIWYRDQPAIITRITHDNQLWIEPDGIDTFKAPEHWEFDYDDGLLIDMLSPHIRWFRN